jgi:hypothetical protein
MKNGLRGVAGARRIHRGLSCSARGSSSPRRKLSASSALRGSLCPRADGSRCRAWAQQPRRGATRGRHGPGTHVKDPGAHGTARPDLQRARSSASEPRERLAAHRKRAGARASDQARGCRGGQLGCRCAGGVRRAHGPTRRFGAEGHRRPALAHRQRGGSTRGGQRSGAHLQAAQAPGGARAGSERAGCSPQGHPERMGAHSLGRGARQGDRARGSCAAAQPGSRSDVAVRWAPERQRRFCAEGQCRRAPAQQQRDRPAGQVRQVKPARVLVSRNGVGRPPWLEPYGGDPSGAGRCGARSSLCTAATSAT